MIILAILRIALKALTRNKMRSALTMLGIIIGVAAVIALVSIGQGAQATINRQIANVGTNIVNILPGSFRQGGMQMGWGSMSTLTVADAEAIQRECSAVRYASPVVQSRGQIVFGNQNWSTQVQGVDIHYLEIRSWPLASGDFFTTQDINSSARVYVIGKTIATNLFVDGDPVGQEIRIKNSPFRVLGVLSVKGQNAEGRDQDDVIMAPYTTVMKKLQGVTNISAIMVSAVSAAAVHTAEQQVTDLLRQRHDLSGSDENDFIVRNLSDIADLANSTNRVLTMLLGSIASVSLLVGGIGVMNIMLVSVTERTREIGIRLAVGATGGDIQVQFLTEAVVLSLLGGLVGIGFGIGVSKIISDTLQWPTLISTSAIGMAFAFSAGVGIFFGFYPARKAASLDPIEALRYE